MGPQVTAVSPSCFYQLRQLRVVRRSLTEDALRSLVQAFIHCRLDYCNALLAEIADTQVKRLQSVQNAAARLVSGARRRDHISLHWLPLRQRIFFKTAVLVWKCIHDVAPAYLQEVCLPVESAQVVLVYGLHRLDAWSCQQCWRQPASGASASTVPQSGTACRLLCATTAFHWTRSRGIWTVMYTTRRRFVTLAPSINVMTYLLTSIEQSATKCLCVKTSSGKVVVGPQPFPYLIVYRYQRELNLNLASNWPTTLKSSIELAQSLCHYSHSWDNYVFALCWSAHYFSCWGGIYYEFFGRR